MNKNFINCFKCKYLRITWDEKRPYGCTVLNFKSKRLPSIEVYNSSGKKCMFFTPKTRKK